MSLFESLNLIALKGAVKPDGLSTMRYVMRWYSKTFHTPLHYVESEIPIADVWLAFYEEKYQGLSREELEEYISLALETPEQRAERLTNEARDQISEAEFAKMTEDAAKKKAVEAAVAKPVVPASLLNQVPVLPEVSLPEPDFVQPDIEIEFMNPADMDKIMDGDFMGLKSK